MAFHLFKRLDRRLASDLKTQRKNIVLGLICVVVTSLLTTATIPLIYESISAIDQAAPQATGTQTDPLKAKLQSGETVKVLAERLNIPETELRAQIRRLEEEESGVDRTIAARQQAVQKLGFYCLVIVGIFFIKYFFTRGQSYFLSKAANELAADLRKRIFRKLMRLPITFFGENRTGAVQSVFTNDVNVYQNAVSIVRDSIDGPIKAIGALVAVFVIQWQLALLAMLSFPLMWLVIWRNGKRMKTAQREVQDDQSALNAVTNEAIQGARVVKSFSAEETVVSSYDKFIGKTLRSQLRAARRVAALRPMVELIGAVALSIVLYAAGRLAFGGDLGVADIAALVFALDTVNQGIRAIGYVNNTYNQVQAASARIYDNLLEVPEEHAAVTGAKTIGAPLGRVEFENVSFSYPDGTPALKNISFSLEPGTSLALVGPSGAGKSTIADLVLRFYDPDQGRILFDGVDIRELDKNWLRSRIGVVPQQNFLFAGSLSDNLRLGKPDADLSEMEEAARMAHANVFIDRLPERFEAEVGERGVGLSGGEMQRIAIARALIRKPTLLLLDEATSALDPESERAVQEALDEVMKQRTTLFIAHRLTTAARADRIMVLRRGEIIETGSHRELIAADGVYAGMYRAFNSGVTDGQVD